jgi:hypothetical protein
MNTIMISYRLRYAWVLLLKKSISKYHSDSYICLLMSKKIFDEWVSFFYLQKIFGNPYSVIASIPQ